MTTVEPYGHPEGEAADPATYVRLVESLVGLPADDTRAARISAQVADLLRDANALNRRMERFSDRDIHPITVVRPGVGPTPPPGG